MKLIIDDEFQILGLVSKDNDLPTITASLFQSPGGRKFLEFMNPFVRYVARHYMKVGDAKLLLSSYKIINYGRI